MLPFWGGKCLPLRFIRVTRLRTETNRPLGGCLMGPIHRDPWSIHSFNYVCVERSTTNVVSIYMCVCVNVTECGNIFLGNPIQSLFHPPFLLLHPCCHLFSLTQYPFDWWLNMPWSEQNALKLSSLSMDKIRFLFDFWIFTTLSNILGVIYH